MKFDASTAPEPLEFDFRPWDVEAHGTVPEPSRKALSDFLEFFDALGREAKKEAERATEAELQAKANALATAQRDDSGTVVISGDLPALEAPKDAEAEPEPESRSWREIILGDDDKAREFTERIGALCQNKPSAMEIAELPVRIRAAFQNTVVSMFVLGDEAGGLKPSGTNS